jgi:calcium/calmodulin-dependent protein kinase I
MGVITYTLLCGYSPFRSENLTDLIDECKNGRIVFHERYWRDVSKDAKDFIVKLLQPDQTKRATSEETLRHPWLKGDTATDHNLLPEIRAYMARARLKRGIEIIKLANRIEALKMQGDDDEEDIPSAVDMAASANSSCADNPKATTEPHSVTKGSTTAGDAPARTTKKRTLSRVARSAIFREVVLAKVREMKEQERREEVERQAKERLEKERAGFV